MDQQPPPPLNPEPQLRQDLYYEIAYTLRASLPPKTDDTAEDRDRRVLVALGAVAALAPANPDEAGLAVQCVATLAHANDCLQQAAHHAVADPKFAARLRAQSASMGREARGFRTTLARAQAARQKRKGNDATPDSTALTEPCTLRLMTHALESLPPQPPPLPAPTAEPPQPATPMGMQIRDYDDWSEEEKALDRLLAESGRYALHNTERVKLIRKLGGLPPDCDFEPPRPELLHEIIHGDHPNLLWADTYEPYKAP